MPHASAEGEVAYERNRARRKRAVRAFTLVLHGHTWGRRLRRQKAFLDGLPAAVPHWRPTLRGDCAQVERPCPYVSCRHHLYLDVLPNGNVKLNFPDLEPHEMPARGSCSLDVAERDGVTVERAAELMNVTRERIRQLLLEVRRLRGRF